MLLDFGCEGLCARIVERPVTAGAACESLRAGGSLFRQRREAVIELVGHRFVETEIELFVGRQSIASHAHLRKLGQLAREVFSDPAGCAFRHDSMNESDVERFR